MRFSHTMIICCSFTIWNLKSAIRYKCGRVVLYRTSVYFVISRLILFFSYSFHVSCIILSNVYFYIVRSMFPFLFNRLQFKASVVNQISDLFFLCSKISFCYFQLFKNGHIENLASKLISVVKLDVQSNNTVSTLSNVVNINIEKGNVCLTLLNLVNFNVFMHNIVSLLIWYCPTSRSHITITTTFRQCLNVFWVFKNVAKSLHTFVKLIKLKTYIFSRTPLIATFGNFCKKKVS